MATPTENDKPKRRGSMTGKRATSAPWVVFMLQPGGEPMPTPPSQHDLMTRARAATLLSIHPDEVEALRVGMRAGAQAAEVPWGGSVVDAIAAYIGGADSLPAALDS